MSAQGSYVQKAGRRELGLTLDSAQVRGMLEGFPTRTIKQGTRIIAQGAQGAAMYYLIDGMVELTVGSQLLDILEPGATFGEMSLIDDEPRSANAVALTDCVIAEIDHEKLLDLTVKEPRFAFFVMRNMAGRLRLLNQMVAG